MERRMEGAKKRGKPIALSFELPGGSLLQLHFTTKQTILDCQRGLYVHLTSYPAVFVIVFDKTSSELFLLRAYTPLLLSLLAKPF